MSTTFGVEIPQSLKDIRERGRLEIVEVAFRSNSIIWKNDLASILPNKTKVIPLDNSAQGIYTIGDIKKAIKKQEDKKVVTTKSYPILSKTYRCTQCGFETEQNTNHYGKTWSVERHNICPKCPPYKKYPEFGGRTTWECQEKPKQDE